MALNVTDANFEQEILKSDIPTLIDFWAPWCAPCQMVAPVVEEIAKKYKDKLKVCKINVDEAPDTASRYGIMSVPTLAIFKDGKIADQIVGALPKSEIEPTIKQYI